MMVTIVVAGRNDNYGGDFAERLLRSATHNSERFIAAGVAFEYVLAEWNPLPDVPLLSETFTRAIPHSRAIVVPAEIHRAYGMNPTMGFYEMPAKNVAIRRARGDLTLVTNADILFDDELVVRIAMGPIVDGTFYRAHRIDVSPALSWPAMKDPTNQLASGEGKLPPAYYLGAGGDFALASTRLWHETTGFNETARFTTRAKDWQFFLSVAARRIPIEFLGNVYHLDHDTGFRHTAPVERDRPTAHFGGQWDIEFGVPASNRVDWGLGRGQDSERTPAIAIVQSPGSLFTAWQDDEDRRWQEWLTHPYDRADLTSAYLAHAILAAAQCDVPLVCRVEQARTAVALSGLTIVAVESGVTVFCSWQWPVTEWMRPRSFVPEPSTVPSRALMLTERAGACAVADEHRTDVTAAILPSRWPLREPAFNPLLIRRLLRAWLRMRAAGYRRLAIFGIGGHTEEMLSWGVPDCFDVIGFVTSSPVSPTYRDLPLMAPDALDSDTVDAVVLSSATYEADMLEAVTRRVVPIPVVPLYFDWPRDLWSPAPP